MATFIIVEEGTEFASIEAETAGEALELAEAKFPRNRSDYNMEPGDAEYTVRWYAREVDGDESDSMLVTVPS